MNATNIMIYRALKRLPTHSDIGAPSGRAGVRQIVQEARAPMRPRVSPPSPTKAGYIKQLVVKYALRRIPDGARLVGSTIRASGDVLTLFRDLRCEPREHCFAVHLNNANRVLSVSEPSVGGMTEAPASFPELFRDALFAGASAIILVHNHPSGGADPSSGDRELMRELCQAASLMRIRVFDFVIIGDDSHWSASDHGLIRSGQYCGYEPSGPATPDRGTTTGHRARPA